MLAFHKLILVISFGMLGFLALYGQVTQQVAREMQVTSWEYSDLSLEEVNQLLEEAEADMTKRKALVKSACVKHNKSEPGVRWERKLVFNGNYFKKHANFYVDREHNYTYCPVYKAGSTTWFHQMLIMSGKSEEKIDRLKQPIGKVARAYFQHSDASEVEDVLRKTVKLLIVRHPFERLLSAYRDKLENSTAGPEHGSFFYYRHYGSKMVKLYRNNSSVRQVEPTFKEFISYLIHTRETRFEQHWAPFYSSCLPCAIDYDIIAHAETLNRDQIYIIKKLHLESLISPLWKRITYGQRSVGETAKKYFKELSKREVQLLYEKFKIDFDLFGYSPDAYFNYAKAQ
ncbi:carbohydrate sulfotransferase 11-like [Neocloeon triangulifer]|uniref:carbohydrate sulfotransferase 11-like n=1 Tax=Neocloeon triangulifer TaxID=2078957 RepID=UPI00286F2E92|nr:carbohydrate sulfotransferase 11-like [Neocloeon triangulifer]